MSKVEQLMAVIRKHPQGIRTDQLRQESGLSENVSALLADAVKRGDLYVCKVSQEGKPPTNEYRIGGGVPVPDFKPLKVGKPVSVAHRTVGAEQAKAKLSETSTAAPKEAPAVSTKPKRRAFAVDGALDIRIEEDGTLTIANVDSEIELNAEHAARLGRFMANTVGVWGGSA